LFECEVEVVGELLGGESEPRYEVGEFGGGVGADLEDLDILQGGDALLDVWGGEGIGELGEGDFELAGEIGEGRVVLTIAITLEERGE